MLEKGTMYLKKGTTRVIKTSAHGILQNQYGILQNQYKKTRWVIKTSVQSYPCWAPQDHQK